MKARKLFLILTAFFLGGIAMAQNSNSSKKILVAYFSWGGNTRGIAQKIAKQTRADIFEIEPKVPYSTNYNTVLKQAQENQHKNAWPELNATVKKLFGIRHNNFGLSELVGFDSNAGCNFFGKL